jgi:LPS sulfotransferase NodH
MPDRFLLFSLPRCGSTTLMRILACHPEISCLPEPFNQDQSGRGYLDRVHDPGTLASTLGEIWAKHQGIKHVWHPSGWPFPDPVFNLLLLDQPNVTVLFLNRRNGLRRLLSWEIAVQTGIWHRDGPIPKRPLAALDLAALQTDLAAARTAAALCLSRLAANQARFEQLWYEDLFGLAAPLADRLGRVDELLRVLGYHPLTDTESRDQVAGLLDPNLNRVNDDGNYRRIPNITDIDAICGNDQVGRVFASEL